MKTIHNALLTESVELFRDNTLRWFDWDKGQLKKKDENGRYPVAYPCVLVRISITSTTDITDKIQECKANVTLTLAFDPLGMGHTAANVPQEARNRGLNPYDVIATVYKKFQGFTDGKFDPLTRKMAGEMTHPDLFVYQIVFGTEFQDTTAQK